MSLRVLTFINEYYEDTFSKLIDLGTLILNVGSSHIYEQNFEQCKNTFQRLPDKQTEKVPEEAKCNWEFVVNSLLACRDNDNEKIEKEKLWRIRP